jgi:hypothetical protein
MSCRQTLMGRYQPRLAAPSYAAKIQLLSVYKQKARPPFRPGLRSLVVVRGFTSNLTPLALARLLACVSRKTRAFFLRVELNEEKQRGYLNDCFERV